MQSATALRPQPQRVDLLSIPYISPEAITEESETVIGGNFSLPETLLRMT